MEWPSTRVRTAIGFSREPSARSHVTIQRYRKRISGHFWAAVRSLAERDASGMTQLGMRARDLHRIRKLPRTIADLEGMMESGTHHLAEAIQCLPRRQV